ncbi:Plant intracellular Ras-group-related LRR protein 8 [Varanus komodoensis]|uniref:uncharacterized protein LOC123035558 n=1 Tax=Varanus komodoensis TaxID=61221 RepID=UPI001CF7BBCF|nr:uncharacterized protein LOC123035558 [Varanus komodoensis]KAF7249068.1 Plant intracellular Ras-group-related LRR protein 8 [Varanus komodoensis]
MVPIKAHNDSNPCRMPSNKDPKPPDPKDISSNPSLLKALEAVVAAGRRGLLGPAAMAAAAAIPELNLGSSNGVVSQQGLNPIPRNSLVKDESFIQSEEKSEYGLNPIPLVETLEKRKKPGSEKRTAVITVVQSVSDAECLQPTPKEIWICGNSVILASKKRAKSHPDGLQLGISTSRAHVYWHGIQAMRWEQLMPLLHEIYHLRSSPSVIIIHVGEDDLLPKNNVSLIISMKNDLAILRRAFPDTIIVWSSLLPRRFWKKGQEPEHMDKIQKHINRKMVEYCNEIGTHFLSHNLITSDKIGLFLPDVNDLSDAGADVFIADLKKVLRFYQIFG